MACCLALATVFALGRLLFGGRLGDAPFPPPASRRRPTTDGGRDRVTHATTATPAPVHAAGSAVALGLVAGALAYLIDVALLSVAGSLDAELLPRAAMIVAGVGGVAWLLRPARRRQERDGHLVAIAGGLAFGTLGLIEMHLLGSISVDGMSPMADAAFHVGGPAVAAGAMIARRRPRPPALRLRPVR